MESPAELFQRWQYLRGLLAAQLDAFETGALRMHSADANTSADAIVRVKAEIAEFDRLIARSFEPR